MLHTVVISEALRTSNFLRGGSILSKSFSIIPSVFKSSLVTSGLYILELLILFVIFEGRKIKISFEKFSFITILKLK